MDIKDLFKNSESLEEQGEVIESDDYIKEYVERQDRWVPDVNYNKPEEWVRFGLAKRYYETSINRITSSYPYDGSLKERQEFLNNSIPLDLYILDNLYPRRNGYALLCADGYGTIDTDGTGLTPSIDYDEPTEKEYIAFKGGPKSGSVWDSDKQRESNLKIDGNKGNTVEFWLKKAGFESSQREVLFDAWTTGSLSSSNDYGRLTLEADSTNNWYVTYQSGSEGHQFLTLPESGLSDGNWHHYAFSIYNESSQLRVKYFKDGNLVSSSLVGSSINGVSGSLFGYIGALTSAPSGSDFHGRDMAGWAKFSGSLDEFRFWKKYRTPEEVSRWWFDQVGGGTNTDDANTSLGVYFKFNEGITQTSSLDSIVLDYSGRKSNGTWISYDTSSRVTASAIVEAGAASREFKDPIVRVGHPDVVSLKSSLMATGSIYDGKNAASLYKKVPNWIVSEETRNQSYMLRDLMQVMSMYFDELHLQAEHMPRLHDTRYVSSSNKPLPHAKQAINSKGLIAPELFVEADVLETFAKRNNEDIFLRELDEIKNVVYQNLYNNLSYILKSKGTEKAIRNTLHCFGVDEDLVRLNLYANNTEYELNDNFTLRSKKHKVINLNTVDNFGGTVYQSGSGTNVQGFIESSSVDHAWTAEATIFFPEKFDRDSEFFFNTPFQTASLFGIKNSINGAGTEPSSSPDGFTVYAVRPETNSKHAKFVLSASSGGVIPILSSSLYKDVYTGQNWSFKVTIKPTSWPYNFVSGSQSDNIVEFCGVRTEYGETQDSFCKTESYTESIGDLRKHLFVGSQRTNLSGSVEYRSDVKPVNARYWLLDLDTGSLAHHNKDIFNYGIIDSQLRADYLTSSINPPPEDALALYWDFQTVTSSDSNGEFVVDDRSSGSAGLTERYQDSFGKILGYQHPGKGDHFLASSTSSIDVEYFPVAKMNHPEVVNSSDTVSVLGDDSKKFTKEQRPITHFYSVEKSLYQTISDEMLNFVGSVKDFNNLIGDPVNRYRQDYKAMNKLKQLFFENVENTPDLEKYIDFYKWVDSALTNIIAQLLPASADANANISNIVESHILERNKYQHRFPYFKQENKVLEAPMKGQNELRYNWKYGHHPLTDSQSDNCLYWKIKAERDKAPLLLGNAGVDDSRDDIHSIVTASFNREENRFVKNSGELEDAISSGINFKNEKRNTIIGHNDIFSDRKVTLTVTTYNPNGVCNDGAGLEEKVELEIKADFE